MQATCTCVQVTCYSFMCIFVVTCDMSLDVSHNGLSYPRGMRPCKRLVACHKTPCIFTGRLQGCLSYFFLVYLPF